MSIIPTLQTKRLNLRALDEQDVDRLYEIFGQPDILRYFPNPSPPLQDKVAQLIASQLEHWDEHGYGWWAVEPRSERLLIGWSGLQYLPDTDEVEVAYLLDRSFWGQGLATEAARAGLAFGFDQIELDQIVAIVHLKNIASQRVAEKSGLPFIEPAHYFGMDCFRYALDRQSYRQMGESGSAVD